jgi:PAS domain S-box-containing protein
VFTVDRDFVITSFNRAAERITGFTAAEAVGERCYNIFRAPVCQRGCLLAETIATGCEVTGLELTILNRSNEEVPISISTAVLRDGDGNVMGGVETFRDLTAVTSLRQQMRRRFTLHAMLSKHHRMQEIFDLVPDVARSNATVLIHGETGTGKELLAHAIHSESPRREAPFVKVNCGALPDTILESELFGHVAGAFTDARADRKGRFELADQGTIFLDEIGDTSSAMQTKLLRVMQDGEFEPVGSSLTRTTDVRVIAATHRDLKEEVAAGRFREDLYYRINTVRVSLPPLRERRGDIPLLTEHFMERFNGLTGKQVSTVSGDAMTALMRHDWPGNVRELEHAIEHAFVLAKGPSIEADHLPAEVTRSSPATVQTLAPAAPTRTHQLAAVERDVIEQALHEHRWNRAAVCRALGMSRTTLWRKMRRLGIHH